MGKNMNEMNYAELNENMVLLNAKVEELNRQLAEISIMKEELSAEIQNRKEQVVSDYILHVKQLMDATRTMIDMGIDPTTIHMEEMTAREDTVSDIENNEDTCISSIDYDTVVKEEKPVGICPEPEIEEVEETSESEVDDMEANNMEEMKPSGKLLTPFYTVWGLCEGAFPRTNPNPAWKHNSPRLHTPFESLCKGPVKVCMNMGNLQYRESYSTPDETRIYSADGISPTLTRVHSDIMVMIGNDPHTLTAA